MVFSVLLAAAAVTAPVPAMTNDWWSNYYDTPSRGLAPGELSVVLAEITVSPRGSFAGCTGHVYAGNPRMGPYVCSRLKMRAIFEPARGPDGKKVTGIYRKSIIVANVRNPTHFRVPSFGIHIRAPATSASDNPFEIQFFLDANGNVSHCSLIETIGLNLERHKQVVDPVAVQRACAEVSTQLKPAPPRDKRGIPIATVQNALVIVDGPVVDSNQER